MKLVRWTATFALLALAPVSWAQRPYSERQSGGFHGQTRMREAPMPQRSEMKEVRDLAQRLDTAMESVQKHADRRSNDIDLTRDEAEGLRRVEILFARADAFEDAVERDTEHPRNSVKHFERMLGSYLLVDESFRILQDARFLNEDFRKAQSTMDELVGFYGGYPEYGGRDYQRMLRRGDANVALGFSKREGLGRSDRLMISLPQIDVDVEVD
jgi:hypothetical protein